MRITYETEFRPNYEGWLAGTWAAGGLTATTALSAGVGIGFIPSLIMSSVFFAAAGYQGFFARSRVHRKQRLEKKVMSFIDLDELADQSSEDTLYLGQGFPWTALELQVVNDLNHNPEQLSELKANRAGATYLHGIGLDREAPVTLTDEESKGHVQIVGTTGAGKTRLFDLLITQAIMRGEAVVIIDPKGDHELRNNAQAAYDRMGRSDDFTFFHPAYPDESAAVNPLASFQRQSELASRLANVVPTSSGGEVFKSFGQNALMGIFFAILIGGANPTIMDVQRVLSEGFGPLAIRALEGWARRQSPEIERSLKTRIHPYAKEGKMEKAAVEAARFYQEQTHKDAKLEIAEMNNLISLLLHDRDHFKKMVASLVPIIGQLCSEPLDRLFSPDPMKDRMPTSGKIISLKQVIENGSGVYLGLDTLSDAIVGRAVGQMILADLASLAGQRYNFGRDKRFVNIFVDEASEVANEQLVQLLNKGRGAGFRLFVATQTLADYAARTGSENEGTMLQGNMNTTVMLRTVDGDTQERLAKTLPEVPIQYVMKTASSSLGDTSRAGAYTVSHGERLMHDDKQLIPPQMFGELSDLEYFVKTPRGEVMKGRLPILSAPDVDQDKRNAERYADYHRDPKIIPFEHPDLAASPPPMIEADQQPRMAHIWPDPWPKRLIPVKPGLTDDSKEAAIK